MAQKTYTKGVVYIPTVLDAVTADTTSNPQLCVGAESISLYITEAGSVNNRSGVFTVEFSPDGTTWKATNMLIDNVTNTNAQNLTRVASKTRAAAGTDILSINLKETGPALYFRVVLDVTDGAAPVGTFTVIALIKY